MPQHVIGCILSMSDYTQTAIEAVEQDRKQVILLFAPEEIRLLARTAQNIDEFLKHKRKVFTRDGRVFFSNPQAIEKKTAAGFPSCSRTLSLADSRVPYFANPIIELDDIMFVPNIPDIRSGEMSGYGVGMQIRLPIENISELKGYLHLIHEQLGLSETGAFSIRQSQCSWHGYGIENFLSASEKWKERYETAGLTRVHHSEDLHYFDSCHNGFILLSARQGVHEIRECLYSCELELHLPGIPVDLAPVLRICEEAQAHLPYFTSFHEKNMDMVRLKTPIPLEPTGQIISILGKGEKATCGLIVKNPFKGNKLLPAGRLKWSPFVRLGRTELLICELTDWHGVGDLVGAYRLKSIEGIQVGQTVVFRCAGTWDGVADEGSAIAK